MIGCILLKQGTEQASPNRGQGELPDRAREGALGRVPAKQAERFAQNCGSSKQHKPSGGRGNLSGAYGASSPKRRVLRLRCDLIIASKLGNTEIF